MFAVIRGVVSSEMRDCGVGETRIPFQLPPPTLNSQQFIDKVCLFEAGVRHNNKINYSKFIFIIVGLE